MDDVTKKDEQNNDANDTVVDHDNSQNDQITSDDNRDVQPNEATQTPVKEHEDVTTDASLPAGEVVTSPAQSATPIEPVVAPVSASTPQESPSGTSAGIVILQWLTYAFWGWTLLALTGLIATVLSAFFTDADTSGIIPYVIAATLVLLPISFVCDIFYGRKEPVKKHGASMVVMVIHAVIFALFGIGMLISAVLVIVQLAISGLGESSEYQIATIVTLLLSTALYALTFIRTLNPLPKLQIAKFYPIAMAAVVTLFIIGGFIGPVAQAQLAKVDTQTDKAVDDITSKVNEYASTNSKLPESLNDLSLGSEATDAIAVASITYKPEGAATGGTRSLRTEELRYQVCANYNRDGYGAQYGSSYDRYDSSDQYQLSADTYNRKSGNVCYKLKTNKTQSDLYDY